MSGFGEIVMNKSASQRVVFGFEIRYLGSPFNYGRKCQTTRNNMDLYRNNTVTTYVIHEVIIVMFVYYVHNSMWVLTTHEHTNHDDLA